MDPRAHPVLARGVALVQRRAVAVWLLCLVACAVAIGRANFTADLSAFLPRSPSPTQQVLVDQLRDGLASRLILIGIDGGYESTRAELSRRVAASLRGDPQFVAIHNGSGQNDARDEQFMFAHRYVL
ncbi:hypothetical protein ACLFKT_41945, partial [Paraburkholderia sp. BR14261]